ncbi:hypothetical protein H4R35_007065, partial [Dimargaris xerosporica]
MKYSIAILTLALTASTGVMSMESPIIPRTGQQLPSFLHQLVNGQLRAGLNPQDDAATGVQTYDEATEETGTDMMTDEETETEEETGEETETEETGETGTEEETGEETEVPPVTDTETIETMPTEESPEATPTATIMAMDIQPDPVDAVNGAAGVQAPQDETSGRCRREYWWDGRCHPCRREY